MNKRPIATRRPRVRAKGKPGFTLAEALCATVIVGLAGAAILVSVASGSRTNDAGRKISEAVFLAQEIREWTLQLPAESETETDLGDLDGVTYNPPRDGTGQEIPDMAAWSQSVSVTWRAPDDLATVVSADSSDVAYVEVTASYRGAEALKTGWLVTK